MKVLLISANRVVDPYPVYPLGLDYVAGALRPKHIVKVLDLNLEESFTRLDVRVRAFQPQIIGLSLRNVDNTDAFDPMGYIEDYRALVQRIRGLSPAPIVLGGSAFTIFPDAFMQRLGADYGIVGEGERLAELLDALENDRDPNTIRGAVTRQSTAPTVPPWEGDFLRQFDPGDEHVGYYLNNGGMLNLQTKRGCPFKCVYCTYPHIEGHRMRRIDPRVIAQTALALQHAGAKYIFITDSAFNADVNHSLAVGRAFGSVGLRIPWGGFFSPIELPHDYFKVLAENGLRHVEFGTESLNDSVLAAYGKPFTLDRVLAAHRSARKAGLDVAHYLLFGGPGETRATVVETLSHIDKLERSVLFLFCGMRIYPQTRLHRIACREGQILSGDPLVEPVFYQPKEIRLAEIAEQVHAKANGRTNWVMGAGAKESAAILPLMYRKGYTGPLWEKLIIG